MEKYCKVSFKEWMAITWIFMKDKTLYTYVLKDNEEVCFINKKTNVEVAYREKVNGRFENYIKESEIYRYYNNR